MVEKIYDYLLKNFGSLGGFEWTLIFLMTAVGIAAAWVALRWIYQQRLDEQQNLLEIRKTTIEEYRERASNLESERGQIQQALAVAEENRAVAEENLETLGVQATELFQHRQDLEQTLRQVAARALILEIALLYSESVRGLHLLFDNVRSLMSLYIGMEIERQVPDAPPGVDLYDECERIAESLRALPDFVHSPVSQQGNLFGATRLPADARKLPIAQLHQLQRQINELYSKINNATARALNSESQDQ